MGADFSIKPVGAPVATPFIRPAPDAVRTAVPTDLPHDKSVTASGEALGSNPPASYDVQADSDRVAHQVIIDRAAAEIVYVVVDKTTNQVINQFPDASRLRARAYFRAQDNAKLETRALATDRSV